MMNGENLFPAEAVVLSGEALTAVLKTHYSKAIDVAFCRLHYRSIHDTYIVQEDKSAYYFKVYRYGLRTKEEIQGEVDCLLHLRNYGIPAVEPVKKNDGSYIIGFNTVQGARYGVLFSSVGASGYPEPDETDESNEKLGKYIAAMHCTWDKLDRPPRRWQLDTKTFIDDSMSHIRAFAALYPVDLDFLELVAVKTKLKVNELDTRQPNFGMCHGDIYSGNWRYDANQHPILFDFDFCGYGWRAYDISMYCCPFSMGCDLAGMEKRERRKEAFLKGYNQVRALSQYEMDSIYLFIPFRRIFNIGSLYISMASVWGDEAARRSVNEDVQLLKKWVDYNPVL